MDWQNVLKRKIETLADYTNASPEERQNYHSAKQAVYQRRLIALRNSIGNVGETSPNIPLEEDMRELQEIRNFHGRQHTRLKRKINKPDYFSPELEEQRKEVKLPTTPRGLRNLRPYLTLEEYQKLDAGQKIKYHAEKANYGKGELTDDKAFHGRMLSRLRNKSNLPTYPTPELGGETAYGVTYTKEEYDSMSREDKGKYHSRMATRFRRENNVELLKFHKRMDGRIRRNSNLPTFYSPEHQEEE